MSQTSRSKVRARERHRIAVARELTRADMLDGRGTLDALEGQASECEVCDGDGYTEPHSAPDCEDCHGSGHNLRGVLPPAEWGPAVRRRATESAQAMQASNGDGHDHPWHLASAYRAACASHWTLTRVDPDTGEVVRDARTRAVPRGTHRQHHAPGQVDWMPASSPRCWVTRLSGPIAPDGSEPLLIRADRNLAPAWRRGELEHDRKRQARRATIEIVIEGGESEDLAQALLNRHSTP